MTPLRKHLRNKLEKTVQTAREIAEKAARTALAQYAVAEPQPWPHLNERNKELRRRLRARARQLGDRRNPDESHTIAHLVAECAYEHWHRMLFARFLAENHLLMHPDGVAVSLKECEELAAEEGDTADGWEVAERYAARMLPQVFRPDAAVLQLTLAPEYRQQLENLLEALPAEVFTASDALGWVYQFWQSQRKNQINKAEVKIGADELPAVTQLFTEHYMVEFLLHNTLGAWWVSRHPDQKPPVESAYLRRLPPPLQGGGQGEVAGWPDRLAELKILDPCCGSGHFLVAAFNLLVPLRMQEENLSAREACDAVLRDNLYGLEIDPRCTEIAAFALALAAWTYPGAGGYRPLPELNLACSGLAVGGREDEWVRFAGNDERLRNGMRELHRLFQQAPTLGSLIDPTREHTPLLTAGFRELEPLLQQALQRETQLGENFAASELGIAARGMAQAAQLLAGKYHLVITNVPYLARGKQDDLLKDFCARHYPTAKNDLATVFLQRCLSFCPTGGTAALVLPQNWLFLTSYKKLRQRLLKEETWNLLARLGPGAFDTISGEVVNVILLVLTHAIPEAGQVLHGLEASAPRTAAEKAALLRTAAVQAVAQKAQLGNPDARVVLENFSSKFMLYNFASSFEGLTTGDLPRFTLLFWELNDINSDWQFYIGSVNKTEIYGGREQLILWENGNGKIHNFPGAYIKGVAAWGKDGIRITQMRSLACTLYCGEIFDKNAGTITPNIEDHLPAIWTFCSSLEFREAVRKIDQKLNVTIGTLVKVPFDLEHWQKVAAEKYPNGLPKPFSNDPTQWIFHGHPCGSVVWDEVKKSTAHGPLRCDDTVLQVAVARLLGYRWPAERRGDVPPPENEDSISSSANMRRDAASTFAATTFELAEEQREWLLRCEPLLEYADEDGIVCIPAVRGEQPAALRLQTLLMKAWGDEWHAGTLDRLLAVVGFAGKSLEDWLRDGFFEQHCALFHQRPFIWHIWDGRKDGFHALVNYHKLDRKRLETLTYTYLGDWLRRQEDELKQNKGGAEARLLAAQILQGKLKQILAGEKPYDIFVRWKPLHEQPVGWEPDLNDGVRLNIRPFVEAEVLRKRPKIHWKKDRGKDPENAPWYHLFQGNRINDHHLSLEEKRGTTP